MLKRFLRSLISEKSWDLSPPISFETKFPLFTLISTYLIFVRFFCATVNEVTLSPMVGNFVSDGRLCRAGLGQLKWLDNLDISYIWYVCLDI